MDIDQYVAADEGDLNRLMELVNSINVNQVNDNKWTVLHYACENGHNDMIVWLIGIGANVNLRAGGHGWTPLHFTANGTNPDGMKHLLKAGADASIGDNKSCIPLHITRDSVECASFLVQAFPSGLNKIDQYWRTPLHLSAYYGSYDVCRFLLNAGSYIDVFDQDRRTPLYWAIHNANTSKRVDAVELSKMFIECGAKLERVRMKIFPDWVTAYVDERNACRTACWTVLGLARCRSSVIGGNGKDALGLVARSLWELRK
jgi:ankyrin repeat protein